MQTKRTLLSDWVDLFTEDMISWALHKVSDEENAKDIVQDTFLAVAENIDKFKEQSSPKTWIFSILKNKIADYYRKQYRQGSTVNPDILSSYFNENGEWIPEKQPTEWTFSETNLLDDLEFIEILNFCLKNLPQKFNTLIKMKYYSQKKHEEICKELEISPTNMWQIMHRAKLKLRECIENGWFKNN